MTQTITFSIIMDKYIKYENLNLVNQQFEHDFKIKFNEFLERGWYILGSEVENFEQSFAKYNGSKYCIGVANGLDAIELGIQVLQLPKNSEIIVPSNTYIATILAIINSGYKPILVEPNINTYNIDVTRIESKISSNTSAILVVHLYGNVAQMDPIIYLSNKYNLKIIEDCAQSHGAEYNKIKTGNFGDIGAFSFYPSKNLGALGDAGAIVTNNENHYTKLKALRNYGSQKKYYNKYLGKNSRLDEIQAMFLNIKLPYLDKINKHKRDLSIIYNAELTNKVIKPIEIDNTFSVFHIYNIRTKYRDELKYYLFENGIQTEIHYPLSPNMQEGYLEYFKNQDCVLSEEIHKTTLSLPISFATTLEEVRIVIKTINKFFEKY
jgi:dTDP-4-amino-4,6-dideoxygalactose transaminase